MTLDFDDQGGITGLTHDEFPVESLGEVTSRQRYSHIWPTRRLLRVAFRLVRLLCCEKGKVARWTRSWKCEWQVRLVSAPKIVRFVSRDRQACIQWEKENLLP
jgi:hypothetical protein